MHFNAIVEVLFLCYYQGMKNEIIFKIYPCDSYDNECFAPQFFDEEVKEDVSTVQPKSTT
jgi:hypothetical protein